MYASASFPRCTPYKRGNSIDTKNIPDDITGVMDAAASPQRLADARTRTRNSSCSDCLAYGNCRRKINAPAVGRHEPSARVECSMWAALNTIAVSTRLFSLVIPNIRQTTRPVTSPMGRPLAEVEGVSVLHRLDGLFNQAAMARDRLVSLHWSRNIHCPLNVTITNTGSQQTQAPLPGNQARERQPILIPLKDARDDVTLPAPPHAPARPTIPVKMALAATTRVAGISTTMKHGHTSEARVDPQP